MISIIMIAYDVEPYLRQAIESVLAQEYKDFELILVVGRNENDNSEAICSQYAQEDPRIKLVSIEPKGPADARNHGIENAKGDYLGFVDADDYIEADMYSSMLKNISESGADIAVCGRYYEYQNKTLSDKADKYKVYNSDEALAVTLSHDGFFLHCWDKLFSRKIYEGLYFRPDIAVEDRIVVDRLLSKAEKIVYDPTPKYHFRERYGSLSKQAGMVRNNIIANELMQDFILENHPGIANECRQFILYEYITAIQNELMVDSYSRQDVAEYRGKVKELYSQCRKQTGRTLRIKSLLAMYCPLVLKAYTRNHSKKITEELERFP